MDNDQDFVNGHLDGLKDGRSPTRRSIHKNEAICTNPATCKEEDNVGQDNTHQTNRENARRNEGRNGRWYEVLLELFRFTTPQKQSA